MKYNIFTTLKMYLNALILYVTLMQYKQQKKITNKYIIIQDLIQIKKVNLIKKNFYLVIFNIYNKNIDIDNNK